MNKVFLTGRITRDLEVRKTQQNKSILSFSIAVDKGTKDQEGKRQAIFIDVQAWEHTADFLEKYAGKGTLIAVEGKIDSYTGTNQQGQKYQKTHVVANQVEILTWPQKDEDPVETITRKQDFTGGGYEEIKSEDLPFY